KTGISSEALASLIGNRHRVPSVRRTERFQVTPTHGIKSVSTNKTRPIKTLAIRFLFATIMRMAITRRQKEVIDFLSSFTQKNGYSPSYEEIASGLGLSPLATVHKHITNLQNKGLLQPPHNRSRSIDVRPVRPPKQGWDHRP